ncbi:hypothetical protein PAHAL_5G288100 [Panicum hallii]|uniref:Uncharacterized protein n=1 Tax=Panicum hallii TaxID=206008 RepID=A0A2S3HV45_9POAL|nr:hypothetical protein PAHAL_5G288100 [Panicum hallii]
MESPLPDDRRAWPPVGLSCSPSRRAPWPAPLLPPSLPRCFPIRARSAPGRPNSGPPQNPTCRSRSSPSSTLLSDTPSSIAIVALLLPIKILPAVSRWG